MEFSQQNWRLIGSREYIHSTTILNNICEQFEDIKAGSCVRLQFYDHLYPGFSYDVTSSNTIKPIAGSVACVLQANGMKIVFRNREDRQGMLGECRVKDVFYNISDKYEYDDELTLIESGPEDAFSFWDKVVIGCKRNIQTSLNRMSKSVTKNGLLASLECRYFPTNEKITIRLKNILNGKWCRQEIFVDGNLAGQVISNSNYERIE